MGNAVAYYRVSTERQGESGLGLDAQKESVHFFAKHREIVLIKEFTEVESGRKKKRPVLLEAILFCKDNKALLIIARLDRLARNVAFVSSLMESKVEFVAVDMPEATHFVVHIMAAVAEYISQRISIDTKNSLQAAKRRGVELGKNGKVLAAINKREAEQFAKQLRPVINRIKKEGFVTVAAITYQLNERKIPAFRPKAKWHISTVHKILRRLKE